MAQRGLGKGLDSLIPASGSSESKEVKQAETMVKIAKVEPNRNQPRKNFDEDALQELADSIKQFGLLQPILVQTEKVSMRSLLGRGDGGRQNSQVSKKFRSLSGIIQTRKSSRSL